MIRDLLNPSLGFLELREDAKGNVQVAGISEVTTRSTDEVCVLVYGQHLFLFPDHSYITSTLERLANCITFQSAISQQHVPVYRHYLFLLLSNHAHAYTPHPPYSRDMESYISFHSSISQHLMKVQLNKQEKREWVIVGGTWHHMQDVTFK
jgi:hypothetical protein